MKRGFVHRLGLGWLGLCVGSGLWALPQLRPRSGPMLSGFEILLDGVPDYAREVTRVRLFADGGSVSEPRIVDCTSLPTLPGRWVVPSEVQHHEFHAIELEGPSIPNWRGPVPLPWHHRDPWVATLDLERHRGMLRGRVLGEDGRTRGLLDFRLCVKGKEGRRVHFYPVTSDREGRFELKHVPMAGTVYAEPVELHSVLDFVPGRDRESAYEAALDVEIRLVRRQGLALRWASEQTRAIATTNDLVFVSARPLGVIESPAPVMWRESERDEAALMRGWREAGVGYLFGLTPGNWEVHLVFESLGVLQTIVRLDQRALLIHELSLDSSPQRIEGTLPPDLSGAILVLDGRWSATTAAEFRRRIPTRTNTRPGAWAVPSPSGTFQLVSQGSGDLTAWSDRDGAHWLTVDRATSEICRASESGTMKGEVPPGIALESCCLLVAPAMGGESSFENPILRTASLHPYPIRADGSFSVRGLSPGAYVAAVARFQEHVDGTSRRRSYSFLPETWTPFAMGVDHRTLVLRSEQ